MHTNYKNLHTTTRLKRKQEHNTLFSQDAIQRHSGEKDSQTPNIDGDQGSKKAFISVLVI